MKLTRRQLNHLIMESLNLQEARVPRPRRLIRNIDAANSRVEKLINMLNDAELYDADGDYTESELEEYREELAQYRDNLKIAKDKELGIKPRQRQKLDPVLEKIEDYLDGQRRKRGPDGMFPQGGERSGSETAAQTPSDKGKKKRKTRAERKANRKAKGAEVATGIVHMVGELKKKLKDETNKRRKQALEKTIDFLEKRQKALKKGAGAPETAPPPFVLDTIELNFEKPATVDFLKNSLTKAPFELSDDDVEELDMISQQEANTSEQEDEDTPATGTETSAQTPDPATSNWADKREGAFGEDVIGNNVYTAFPDGIGFTKLGDVLSGKGKSAKGDLPGLPTAYVSTVKQWSDVNARDIKNKGNEELGLKALNKFEETTANAVETFNGMGREKVSTAGKKLGSGTFNNFIYDGASKRLYYDSAGFTNYMITGVELTSDGKHLVLKGMNESRSYGKSHATLLRERYWGRY